MIIFKTMNLNDMKSILIKSIAFTALSSVISCAELELANPNQPTESSFWQNEDELYKGVIATYDALQTGLYDSDMRIFLPILADEGTNEAPWEFNDLARFTQSDLNQFEGLWSANYELIGRAYQVIDNADGLEGSRVPRIVAEAKFLAALGYYNLISGFGENIAYVDQIQNAASRPPRAKDGEAWQLTEDLLNEAIPDLPLAGAISSANYGRVSKGAAQSLLAKVHMQQREWDQADDLLLTVIQSGQYELNANFEDNFIENNDINPESVFHVNFLHNGSAIESDNAIAFKLTSLGEARGAYGDVQSQNIVRDEFLMETDVDGNQDPRMNATIFWDGTDRVYYGQTHNWWMNNADIFNPDVNTAFYKYSEQSSVGSNPVPDVALPQNGGTDFIVIRYADVLLLYAEALNELGSTNEAYPFIDEVRERSNMEPLSTAFPGLNQSQFREQIKHERLLELAGEVIRWFDLKRWGDYGPASAVNDPNFETFTVGQDEVFPIPQSELDLNENLQQNPGY